MALVLKVVKRQAEIRVSTGKLGLSGLKFFIWCQRRESELSDSLLKEVCRIPSCTASTNYIASAGFTEADTKMFIRD